MDSEQEAVAAVREAALRVAPYVLRTPVLASRPLSAATGADVWLKLENEQHTGSFKIRGATNRILGDQRQSRTSAPPSVPDEAFRGAHGFVTASSGNHGLAVATALEALDLPGTVVLPTTAAATKIEALRQFKHLEIVLHGQDCVDAETHARRLAETSRRPFISPYNDPLVMAGQGTVAVEVLEQIPDVDAVFVTVGGGGLAGGMATWIKHMRPSCHVVGCQPAASPVMYESVKAGKVIDMESAETLSDGSAGGIELDSITFEPCRRYIDEWVLVNEGEIAAAMRLVLEQHHKVIEGAAGVALASFLKVQERYRGQRVVVVLCGANVGVPVLRQLLSAP